MKHHLSVRLETAFRQACVAELEALKPGNVHVLSDGHGMTVQDFLKSADASASVIAKPDISIGQRILQAIQATHQAVGCNTNLGIVLLCAPLIETTFRTGGTITAQDLQSTLQQLTVEDAAAAYTAIQLANPAGLGASEAHDVHAMPDVNLLEAMRAAADRDMVARQYACGYQDILNAMPYFDGLLQRWGRPAWATSALYLHFLSSFPDSHIVRKFGHEIAEGVRQEAATYWKALEHCDNPKTYLRPLLDFDRELKTRGINPGTSADLVVSTLYLVNVAQDARGKIG